jgi:3-oxoacyl-[acyl-carrier-protein] synthase-3
MFPSTACKIQAKIGASKAWGFDLSGACSGFIFGLATGAQFIENGTYEKVVVVGTDIMTSIVDPEDRATCVLFGDGSGAVLLEPSPDPELGLLDFHLRCDGSGAPYLHMPAGGSQNPASIETVEKRMHYVHQDGRTVFKFAVRYMAEASLKILKKNGFTKEDLDLLVPHQANLRIIKSIGERLKLREDQVAVNIERYANTTAATIPISLFDYMKAGKLNKGDLVVITSFGAGFTWGSALLRWGI